MKRYRLYLFNTKTGERQNALVQGSKFLSLAEAKRMVAKTTRNAKRNNSEWVYKYEPLTRTVS